jgi:hypothetical protein
MICLSTAHPAKFPAAIEQATGQDIARHELIEALADLPTRSDVVAADADMVRDYMVSRIGEKPEAVEGEQAEESDAVESEEPDVAGAEQES